MCQEIILIVAQLQPPDQSNLYDQSIQILSSELMMHC